MRRAWRPSSALNAPLPPREQVEARVRALGPWFHNLTLAGVATAPDHFLGDYPRIKWQRFAHALPADLSGKSVLDIGCNAGFYAIEMARRGAARVVGIDHDPHYLEQARYAAELSGCGQIEFRQLSTYDVGALGERFDLVLFLGVLYHLRHPLLALDLLHAHVVRDLLVVQSMQRGATDATRVADDYPFDEAAQFDAPGWPKLHFIEHAYAHDCTNWWAPNEACMEAMLRAAGFRIESHPEDEVYVCRRVGQDPAWEYAVYPRRGKDV
jgi:tRNA (mo5U34)-methyltransferase